jgi:hypothetical protein
LARPPASDEQLHPRSYRRAEDPILACGAGELVNYRRARAAREPELGSGEPAGGERVEQQRDEHHRGTADEVVPEEQDAGEEEAGHDAGLGEALLKSGDVPGATKAYEKSVALNPGNENSKAVLACIRGGAGGSSSESTLLPPPAVPTAATAIPKVPPSVLWVALTQRGPG